MGGGAEGLQRGLTVPPPPQIPQMQSLHHKVMLM